MHLGRPELRKLMHAMPNFKLSAASSCILFYRERTGELAPCVVGEEIISALQHHHDGHGHFAEAITLSRLTGEAYWPTRVCDVKAWCRLCTTCQATGPRQPVGQLQHIQEFEPMSMIGLDFLGPITPACSQTGCQYILIAIDYFSRLTWAGAYKLCTMTEVCYLLTQHMAPVFGWPKAIYTDNGLHFMEQAIRSLFEMHGVAHFTAPVTHPSSVGLVERNVQLMMSQLRKRSIDSGLPTPA